MKIAVYTIAKNEEAFVQRWYDSAKEADHLFKTSFKSVNTLGVVRNLAANSNEWTI